LSRFPGRRQGPFAIQVGSSARSIFPDLVEALKSIRTKKFVLDGEIVIPLRGRLWFDELLMRIHPAESRVRKLADAHPATYVAFDLLLDERGHGCLKCRWPSAASGWKPSPSATCRTFLT
jgi:hypothetical protein